MRRWSDRAAAFRSARTRACSFELPSLAWSPGTGVIHARANGDQTPSPAFWHELGIDPKPLVQKHDGFWEIDAHLDFAGKLVK